MPDHWLGVTHVLGIVLEECDEIGDGDASPDHQRALRDDRIQANQVDIDEGLHVVTHVINA